MKLHGKKQNPRCKDASRRKVVGTRFHELFLSPLPNDATVSKVKELLRPTGVQCKDVRIHKGGRVCSAFIVFHCDADAAAALKAFKSDPLYVQDKRIDVRYTINYSDETTNHYQQVTDRIKQSFSWMVDNNICVRDLPKELEHLVGTTSFTDVNTNFSCNERHTECAFFSSDSKLVGDDPEVICPIQPPEVVTYKTSEILQLYKKSQEPVDHCLKVSKSSRKKSVRKKQALAKIEAELNRQATYTPPQPGMGRGFCQKGARNSTSISKPKSIPAPSDKPFAIICPTQRDEKIFPSSLNRSTDHSTHVMQNTSQTTEKDSGPNQKNLTKLENYGLGRGRGAGIATLSADMLRELSKF